jgi:hypothetical protein
MPQATRSVAGLYEPGRRGSRPHRGQLQHGQLQIIALQQSDSNNYLDKSHRPGVRCRAMIPTTGPKSATSRQTHPKNPQCGNRGEG